MPFFSRISFFFEPSGADSAFIGQGRNNSPQSDPGIAILVRCLTVQ
jgi:hypothetical protein